MAAPKFVPVSPVGAFRSGETLPAALEWRADRPGDLVGAQPKGTKLGNPGPDQGYAIKLANMFHGKLHLSAGEHEHDVLVGILGVALKRASLYGRAPVIHDLTRALDVFGFRNANAPKDLVAFRTSLFEAAGHHYELQREIADVVPESTLSMGSSAFDIHHGKGWRSMLNLAPVEV
jgi:hypothetical protein